MSRVSAERREGEESVSRESLSSNLEHPENSLSRHDLISPPRLKETWFVELCRKADLSAQFPCGCGILSAELAELSRQKLRR